MEFNGRLIPNHDADWTIAIDHMKTIAAAKKIVALTAYHFPRRFARLPFESPLLTFDPTQLADHSQPYSLIAYPERCSNSNSPGRRIHSQVKILYVFPHNLDAKA